MDNITVLSATKEKNNSKNFHAKQNKTSAAKNENKSVLNVVKPNFAKAKQTANKENLKIMFLGGVGEIGKNMTVLQYKNDIIIIDCGLAFPSEDMPGIDIVIPDFSYLIENKDKIKGLFITHAHEDHIGSIKYFLKDVNVPVYGSKFTLGMVEEKLAEAKGTKLKGFVCRPGQQVKVGHFNVEFIHVNHSTAGCFALAISTPVGMVVHSGDFKVDYTPVNTDTIDLQRFAELGRKGVLLFMCESTNVCKKGHSMSESLVGKTLNEVFEKEKGRRIIVATFASNTYRLHQIMQTAERLGRKICFTGRSMLKVSECAAKCGELTLNKQNIVEIDKIKNIEDGRLCIITTGSQGEAMSGLTRMANDEFPQIQIGDNDTIVFSSSPIPGNEKSVNNVINALYKKGAKVINNELEEIHASGHACEDEIILLHKLVKPKFFIPVHGEYMHMISHKELAKKLGMQERNILIPAIGAKVEVNEKAMKLAGVVQAGERLIDGTGFGELDSLVIRDRKQLSEDGVCVCIIGLDRSSGEITLGPDIIARGLIYSEEMGSCINGAKEAVRKAVSSMEVKTLDSAEIRNQIKKGLTHYFFKTTQRKPLILTVIFEG